ncbi:MAG: hypothetical protein KDK28_20105 [Maritimibacter sp.]|nr:hypothetical protein [Maritimibacter sp.]
MTFLDWIETTRVALFIQTSSWAFPAIEVIHVIAVVLVFGTIAVVDLRLLGLASTRRPYLGVAGDGLRVVWIAFAVAVVTGLLMFSTQAGSYFENTYFRIKMLALLAAGVNMMVMEVVTSRDVARWGATTEVALPTAARAAGLLSLAFWTIVVVCGRWIGFTMFSMPF